MIRSIPTFVAHVEFCPFVARPLPENGCRVTPRHELQLQTYLSPVVRKREFVICIRTLVHTLTTRPLDELLTLLCFCTLFVYLFRLHKYESYDTFQDGSGADSCPL